MAPGTQVMTYWQMGKESSAGTSVAATRRWFPNGTGAINIDNHMSIYRGNRGNWTMATGGIEMGEDVQLTYQSNPDIGLLYDELPFILGQIDGGNSPSGALANKTWTIAPSQTAANSPESYTIEVGDDTQEFEFEYAQARSFTISAAVDSMTQLEVDWFARQSAKSTKTALSSNLPLVGIPGYLWKVRFASAQSGLAGASDQDNFLLDFNLNTQTTLAPRHYMAGNKYFGQSVETRELTASLTMHVESTATAVSQFYDKWRAQTVDFIQLKATGPTLGSANYSAQAQLALLYTNVVPISSEQDGVNIYEVEAIAVNDPTWAQSMAWSVVCSTPSIA